MFRIFLAAAILLLLPLSASGSRAVQLDKDVGARRFVWGWKYLL